MKNNDFLDHAWAVRKYVEYDGLSFNRDQYVKLLKENAMMEALSRQIKEDKRK